MTYQIIKNVEDAENEQDAVPFSQVQRMIELHSTSSLNPHLVSLQQVLEQNNGANCDIDMTGNKITNLPDAESDADPTTWHQTMYLNQDLDTKIDLHNSDMGNPHNVSLEQSRSVSSKLKGSINMSLNRIKNLKPGAERGDAVEFEQFESHYKDNLNPHLTSLEQARSIDNTLSGPISMNGYDITNVRILQSEVCLMKETDLDVLAVDDGYNLLYSTNGNLYWKTSDEIITNITKPKSKPYLKCFDIPAEKSTTSSEKLIVFELEVKEVKLQNYKLSWSCELSNTNRHVDTKLTVESVHLGEFGVHHTSVKRANDICETCTGFKILKDFTGSDLFSISIRAHPDGNNTAKIKNLSVVLESM